MADPARIKPEDKAERVASIGEEQENSKSDESEDTCAPLKSTDDNKDSSSQDKDKQEPKSVSRTTSNMFLSKKALASFYNWIMK